MTPTVSFAAAIPVGSWHAFIPAAFASLAAQGVNLEVALVDASGDPRVAEAADRSNLSFAYRRHGPDKGQADAIDEGWRHTRGDIVFWLNGDDRLASGALKTIGEIFDANPDVDVIYGRSGFIDANGRHIGMHDQVEAVSDLLYRSNIISQPSCFVRRKALEAANGIDTSLHYVMDWELWIRLYACGARFFHTEQRLSDVYVGDDTKTGEVSLQRLREVYTVVRRYAGHWPAIKSTVSLWAHTLRHRRQRP
ncbi:glycosyltransferase [Maricaulis sp.]|uniref:glycosyltransferase n=1 Tax=Maricaulis sp. TaxID=1486257 RepID=UPI002607DD09|nr:glycosyltransferase [Maricaulis sp.]